jgi:isopentenyl diphosphate isomerase/L-lactate dehydrogenase-like FMN-dependent dehydrogenase
MGSRGLDNVVNLEDMRLWARRRLPGVVFDVIDGGATDELTLRANRSAFDQVWFRPRALAPVDVRTTQTSVLRQTVALPVMLAPCGFARLVHPDPERAAARAAAQAGTIYVVPDPPSSSAEEVARAAPSSLWYQLYLPRVRRDAVEKLARVQAAGYETLCVTVDTPVRPMRERDVRNKVKIPLRPSIRLAAAGLSRPRWAKEFLFGRVGGAGVRPYQSLRAYKDLEAVLMKLYPVTRGDLEWLRTEWPGRLVVKGILRAEECEALTALGVDGVVVSNHGGRNLDGVRPTIDVLPEVVEAVNGLAEVFLDSGVRRGADVVKALALGAQACLIGRPYMFGLATAGEAGVSHVLEILKDEIDRTMAQLGCASVAEIDQTMIFRRG